MNKNELTIFNYGFKKVRTIIKDGDPWFVLKDVCAVLGISNPTVVTSRLEEDEVTKFNLGSLSGESNVVNESGLYNVILRSDKPEARKFKRWITHEVLPSIRKTGAYAQTPKTYLQALKELVAIEEEKEKLQIELDKSKEFFSIKRVASINGISWKQLDWKKLKNTSQAMEQDVRRIFDANYGNVNAYHIDVWKHEYPELRYS